MNVRGLSNRVKRKQIYRHIKDRNIDIACLQETHCTKNKHRIWQNEYGGKIIFSDGESNSRGVAILFNRNLNPKNVSQEKDTEGRYVITTFNIDEVSYAICNLYAPNQDKPKFFVNIFDKMQKVSTDHVIITGDFNVCIEPQLDKRGGNINDTKSAELIRTFKDENQWVDPWRLLNQDKFQYTFKKRKPLVMTRLDYFLLPMGTQNLVCHCEIIPSFLSDHNSVELTLATNHSIRGPGFWKFNATLLKNQEYANGINEIIERSTNKYTFCNPINKWENIKYDIQQYSKIMSKSIAKNNKLEKDLYTKRLKAAQKKLEMINLQADNAVNLICKINGKIDECKAKLHKFSLQEAQGAMLRAKTVWVQEAEHNTKYFFSLEKTKAKAKIMNMVVKDDGSITNKPKEILIEQEKFYRKLYTSNENITSQIPFNMPKTITQMQKVALDAEITIDEIQESIRSMAKNKTPGTDGLPADWYQFFWSRIKHIFYEMVQYSIKQNKLPNSTREIILSLIPKGNSDPKFVRHWRPILLLNVDYKVISKVIAKRIKENIARYNS